MEWSEDQDGDKRSSPDQLPVKFAVSQSVEGRSVKLCK